MILGCSHGANQNSGGTCDDVTGAKIYISNINDIKNKEELNQRDVKYISNPLSPNFNIDIEGCPGTSDMVREEAKSALIVKKEILWTVC